MSALLDSALDTARLADCRRGDMADRRRDAHLASDELLKPRADEGVTFRDVAPIRSVESEHPWLWALYLVVAILATLASTFYPWGTITW